MDRHSSGTLKTFAGYVEHNGKIVKAAILMDDGSTDSFCSERLARRLDLPSFGGQSYNISTFMSKSCDDHLLSSSPLTLKTLEEDIRLKVVVVPNICSPRNTSIPPLTGRDKTTLAGRTLTTTVKPGTEIDLLIASDFYYSVLKNSKFINLECGMVAVDTKCGVLICGATPYDTSPTVNFISLSATSSSTKDHSPKETVAASPAASRCPSRYR